MGLSRYLPSRNNCNCTYTTHFMTVCNRITNTNVCSIIYDGQWQNITPITHKFRPMLPHKRHSKAQRIETSKECNSCAKLYCPLTSMIANELVQVCTEQWKVTQHTLKCAYHVYLSSRNKCNCTYTTHCAHGATVCNRITHRCVLITIIIDHSMLKCMESAHAINDHSQIVLISQLRCSLVLFFSSSLNCKASPMNTKMGEEESEMSNALCSNLSSIL